VLPTLDKNSLNNNFFWCHFICKPCYLFHSLVLQRCPLNATAICCDLGTLLVAKILVYSNLLPATNIIVLRLQRDRQRRI
jgi:hypothetical protein